MKPLATILFAIASVCAITSLAAADTFGVDCEDRELAIEFVTIGSPGNFPDTTGNPRPAGAVDYVYRIGKYEISRGMIESANRLGDLGITLADMSSLGGNGPDQPATEVSWHEAARFTNWLNASTGYIEPYKLVDGGSEYWLPEEAGYNPENPIRNSLARYFLPTVDEWYKAAYYDPAEAVYYDFATGSDSAPDPVADGTSPATAIYLQPFDSGPAEVTRAGGLSPFGTMGQGGNVYEWEESEVVFPYSDEFHAVRGGAWWSGDNGISSLSREEENGEHNPIGFRVASVPEPSSSCLAVLGMVGLLMWRRR